MIHLKNFFIYIIITSGDDVRDKDEGAAVKQTDGHKDNRQKSFRQDRCRLRVV